PERDRTGGGGAGTVSDGCGGGLGGHRALAEGHGVGGAGRNRVGVSTVAGWRGDVSTGAGLGRGAGRTGQRATACRGGACRRDGRGTAFKRPDAAVAQAELGVHRTRPRAAPYVGADRGPERR